MLDPIGIDSDVGSEVNVICAGTDEYEMDMLSALVWTTGFPAPSWA